jgi:hypothetical protein
VNRRSRRPLGNGAAAWVDVEDAEFGVCAVVVGWPADVVFAEVPLADAAVLEVGAVAVSELAVEALWLLPPQPATTIAASIAPTAVPSRLRSVRQGELVGEPATR